MIGTLIKREFKSNGKLYVVFLALIAMYSVCLTAMYDPALKDTLEAMQKTMPGVFKAMGMQDMGTTFLDFMVSYLYKLILVLIPSVFSIMMCYRLLGKYVENGSLAYLLNSKHSRLKIALTQWMNLFSGLVLLVLFNTLLVIICNALMKKGTFELSHFLLLNFGLLSLHVFLASFCFMCTCVFSEAKYSVGVGSGVVTIMIIMQMLSQVNDKAEFLTYCNPLSLFDPEKLAAGNRGAVINVFILWAGAFLFLFTGFYRFRKKDLSL